MWDKFGKLIRRIELGSSIQSVITVIVSKSIGKIIWLNMNIWLDSRYYAGSDSKWMLMTVLSRHNKRCVGRRTNGKWDSFILPLNEDGKARVSVRQLQARFT